MRRGRRGDTTCDFNNYSDLNIKGGGGTSGLRHVGQCIWQEILKWRGETPGDQDGFTELLETEVLL